MFQSQSLTGAQDSNRRFNRVSFMGTSSNLVPQHCHNRDPFLGPVWPSRALTHSATTGYVTLILFYFFFQNPIIMRFIIPHNIEKFN